MLSKNELLDEVLSLPIEDKAYLIDSLIKSMNPINTDIDHKWVELSRIRLNELRTGKLKAIAGEKVFDKVWKRFNT